MWGKGWEGGEVEWVILGVWGGDRFVRGIICSPISSVKKMEKSSKEEVILEEYPITILRELSVPLQTVLKCIDILVGVLPSFYQAADSGKWIFALPFLIDATKVSPNWLSHQVMVPTRRHSFHSHPNYSKWQHVFEEGDLFISRGNPDLFFVLLNDEIHRFRNDGSLSTLPAVPVRHKEVLRDRSAHSVNIYHIEVPLVLTGEGWCLTMKGQSCSTDQTALYYLKSTRVRVKKARKGGQGTITTLHALEKKIKSFRREHRKKWENELMVAPGKSHLALAWMSRRIAGDCKWLSEQIIGRVDMLLSPSEIVLMLEGYYMSKVHDTVMSVVILAHGKAEKKLSKGICILAGKFDMHPPRYYHSGGFSVAIAAIKSLIGRRTPFGKLLAIREAVMALGAAEKSVALDDILPIVVCAVVASGAGQCLYSQIVYIKAFHYASDLSMSEYGYYVTCFESVLEYIRSDDILSIPTRRALHVTSYSMGVKMKRPAFQSCV